MEILSVLQEHYEIQIGVCSVGVLEAVVLFFSSFADRTSEKTDSKFFCILSGATFLYFEASLIMYLIPTEDYTLFSLRLYKSITYVLSFLILYTVTVYMIFKLQKKAFIDDNLVYHLAIIYGVIAIVFVVGMFQENCWFYTYDADGMLIHRSLYYIFFVIQIVTAIFNIGLILSCKDVLSSNELISWIVVFIFPLLAAVATILFDQNLTNTGIAIAILMLYVNIHFSDVKDKQTTEKELVESRAKLMVSQIQPHFMYNSLNSIYYLIGEDPEKAQEAVSTFSDYLRGNVNSLKNDQPVPIKEELNHVNAYLSLEKLRFGDKISITITENSGDFLIPPLSVQPLVENAVKHGLSVRRTGGNLWISTYEDDDSYNVEIKDDGVGFEAGSFNDSDGKSTHVGLFNVSSRIQSKMGGRLKVVSIPGEGTTCTISIPKKKY